METAKAGLGHTRKGDVVGDGADAALDGVAMAAAEAHGVGAQEQAPGEVPALVRQEAGEHDWDADVPPVREVGQFPVGEGPQQPEQGCHHQCIGDEVNCHACD